MGEAPRWIEVDGRRWRATDPSIPSALRSELVDELMRARRAIRALGRRGDPEAVLAERVHVKAAKVALGERGEPWWEPPSDEGQRERMRSAIVALARHRVPDGSICPSDAARAIGGEAWRDLLPLARDEAAALEDEGTVVVTQGGEPAGARPWSGPVRIRWCMPAHVEA